MLLGQQGIGRLWIGKRKPLVCWRWKAASTDACRKTRVQVIAKALWQTRDSVHIKITRLEVVVQPEKNTQTTTCSGIYDLPKV